MHIGFRRSGGRGEYELVGSHSGFTASSLDGWRVNLGWPDGIVRETGLECEPAASGKPRLRSTQSQRFQIGRMVAAMMLLPDPRREFAEAGSDLPRVGRRGYVLTRLGFGPDTEFAPVVDMVTIDPTFVELEDAADTLAIGVGSRWARLERIYSEIGSLPAGVGKAVDAHRALMASGAMPTVALVQAVSEIDQALVTTAGAQHIAGFDVVPSLEQLLGLAALEGPTLPPPDELGEEEPEVSARAAAEYRKAKMRGASARKFSLDVRKAYAQTCAFCGLRFGGVPGVRTGIDAAHILAWSRYDLDVVSNGVGLCKLHHWAFDAALVMPRAQSNGEYTLHLTELASPFPADARARIVPISGMVIPQAWLPAEPGLRPSKKYLERLYADLAVTFVV